MPHSGSDFSASSYSICEARYQNECWYSIARSKCFCASPWHDVSKWTSPSLPSSPCAKAGCAAKSASAVVTVIASDLLMDAPLDAPLRTPSWGAKLGVGEREVISEKRDFYRSPVVPFRAGN